jgi:hypothetical protein
VSNPETPPYSKPPLKELHPRADVFDNIMSGFSERYRRTLVGLRLAQSVHNADRLMDGEIQSARKQFASKNDMTVGGISKILLDGFKYADNLAGNINRSSNDTNISDGQLLPPPIALDTYKLSKDLPPTVLP